MASVAPARHLEALLGQKLMGCFPAIPWYTQLTRTAFSTIIEQRKGSTNQPQNLHSEPYANCEGTVPSEELFRVRILCFSI